MDSRAKQRLTGAVILVALFVLLVPELLTGPGHAKTAEPVDESGMRRYTIDLTAPQSSVQTAAQALPAEVQLPEVAQQPPADSPRAVAPLALPGKEAAVAVTPALETPAPAPTTPRPVAPTAAAPVASTAPARTAPAPAPAIPETPARTVATPASGTGAPTEGVFAVQLGTFENRDNANRLVRDMSSRGFAAFVAPFKKDGRELYRVRVGPTRDRAAAEALASQLKRVGQPGSVVSIS